MAPNAIKVLVAEDEPTMLALLASHVRHLGFSVIEASEGDVAWQLLEEQGPDLVILDVMMPGMSGWDICKRLKSHTVGPLSQTGVIMLTGIGETLNDATSELFGADAWLNKPFEFVDLDRTIYATLASYGKLGSSAPGSTLNGLARPAPRVTKRAAKPTSKKSAAGKAPARKAVKASAPKKVAAAKKGAAKKASPARAAASTTNTTAAKKAASGTKTSPAKNGAAAKKATPIKRAAAKSAGSTAKSATPKKSAKRGQPAGRAKR